MRIPFEQRFWLKVDRREPGECWPWLGAKLANGYGSLGSVEVNGERKVSAIAHRVSFYLANGYWPTVTRHSCDNRPCVNPDHLIDGTHAENMQDAIERGRNAKLARTSCRRGHEYPDPPARRKASGCRFCRICKSEDDRTYREARK